MKINVTSIQQYTIDRLRVSLNDSYEVDLLLQLSFDIFDSEGNSILSKFKTITESNNWRYTEVSDVFDIYVNENQSIEEGTYQFVLFKKGEKIFESPFKTSYMEDVRVEFDKVYVTSPTTIHAILKPITQYYQTVKMMRLMKFSVITTDESKTHFSDNFMSLSDSIDRLLKEGQTEIREFDIVIEPGKTLPQGYYDVRLTSFFKSRNFPLVEKFTIPFPFMTTESAKISSVAITKQASTGDTVMSVSFNPFLERGLLLSAKRSIIRDKDGKDITDYFDASRISTTSYSLGGIRYISRLDIPLYTQHYDLAKGNYTLSWKWHGVNDQYGKPLLEDFEEDVTFTFETGWVVNALQNLEVFEGRIIDFDLPEAQYTKDFLREEKLIIEHNGVEIDPTGIFGPLNEVSFMKTGVSVERSDHFGVRILNADLIQKGNYKFILWKTNEKGEVRHEYMGDIDIIQCLTPKIIEAYHSDIDAITIVLEKPYPIQMIENYIVSVYDQYGTIDLSNNFYWISDSNVWEPGQTVADRFDLVIKDSKQLANGSYQLKIRYRDSESNLCPVIIKYLESRRGYIKNIEQISLDKIKITFSEPQSRQFLLSTKFLVERKIDGAQFESRFEYLENVLKADQMTFTEIEIPIDNEDNLPKGRYAISFEFENKDHQLDKVIYSFDVELDFMTSMIPSIEYAIADTSSSGVGIEIVFKNDLERELYNCMTFFMIRESDQEDISIDFEDKEDWKIDEYEGTVNNRGIRYIRKMTIPARSLDVVRIERGIYTVKFSWDGVVSYAEDLTKKVFLEYYLPKLKHAEVVDMDMSRNWARVYFEMEEAMQFEYFKDLHVEVLSPSGEDATDKFEDIQSSNNITDTSTGLSSNNFNINCIDARHIELGKYQFIFYHLYPDITNPTGPKIRESESMYMIELMDALRPRIATAIQSAHDRFTITLVNAIPRRLLETLRIEFRNTNHTNHSNDFLTIDASNTDRAWPEDLREVSVFDYVIKAGAVIEEGTYILSLYNQNVLCDQFIFDIIHMEGANGRLDSIRPVALNKIELNFMELESKLLFSTFDLRVYDEDGKEYTSRFKNMTDYLRLLEDALFNQIEIEMAGPLPRGTYNFEFSKLYEDNKDVDVIGDNYIKLPFLSNEFPFLYDVYATKIGSTMDGDDGLVMWFNPPLEKGLFDACKFGVLTGGNMDIDYAYKFKPINEAILDMATGRAPIHKGIDYVEFATLEFGNKQTLTRDNYLIKFDWTGDYSYMKSLEKEARLDYILFPLESVEQIDTETIRLTFKSPTKAEDMARSEVYVETTKLSSNADGPVTTTVNFSNNFMSMQKSNTFEPGTMVPYVDVRMGRRSDDVDPQLILPPDTYRFIISTPNTDEDDYILEYRYAGSLYIDFMMNSDQLLSESVVNQISYDTLQYSWALYQYCNSLNNFTFIIRRKDPQTDDIVSYSQLFMDTYSANYYRRLKNDDEWEEGNYEYARENDIVIDEVHYKLLETNKANAKLAPGKALPAHTYEVGFEYNKKEYFLHNINLPFMTSTPPEIYTMSINNENEGEPYLSVRFYPYAEIKALESSSFEIYSYRGLYKDGSIRGNDVTHYFGTVSSSEFIQVDSKVETEITYINEIRVPVLPGAIIATGNYMITWLWPEESFFPDTTYIGGLNLLGKGIELARTIEKDTIEITFKETILARDLKRLNLGVKDSRGKDHSDAFMPLEESNKDIPDTESRKIYFLKLDEKEELTDELYTFTLTEEIDEKDEEGEEVKIKTDMAMWQMNLIYLTTDFPGIDRIDNMSVEKFEVIKLSKDNVYPYLGREIQLLTSKDSSEIETLTQLNAKDYNDQYIRVYGKARIDRLNVKIDEEITGAFIQALEVSITDEDGNDMTDHFLQPRSTNTIDYRDVLYGIRVRFTKFYKGRDIKKFEFVVETADKRDISTDFATITNSNELLDNSQYKEIMLIVDDDIVLEKYDVENLSVRMTDHDDKIILNLKTELCMTQIQTNNYIDLPIQEKTTLAPDDLSFRFRYTNEPNIEECVYLYPFSWAGPIPFLSNHLGVINQIVVVDMESIDLVFSELSLPISAFLTFDLRFINDEGDELDPDTFVDLNVSNNFGGAYTLAELDEPGVIHLQLEEGKSIPGGMYKVQFWIDISAQDGNPDNGEDDDEPSDDVDEEEDDDENIHTGEYMLWEKYTTLPVMFREMVNSIQKVEVYDIDTLKVTLEKPLSIDVIRNFNVDVYSILKDVTYQEKFKTITDSNFFGMHTMCTDNRMILYSTDGSFWNNYDTGYDYAYTKIFYHEPSEYYFALTGNGKIIRFKSLTNTTWGKKAEIVNYGTEVKTSFNDYTILNDNTIIIVGNNGTIMRGTISSNGNISLTNINPNKLITKNTLAAIINNGNVVFAVGYRGTIIRSDDGGITWVTMESGVRTNLTCAVYHQNSLTIEGEDADPPDDDEEPMPAKEPDEVVNMSGYFVAGVGGIVLVCQDIKEGFVPIDDIGTSNALFAMCSRGDAVICVGDAGTIVSVFDTEDGYSPSLTILDDINSAIRDVKWCGTKYFACAANGAWITSSKGEKWKVNQGFNVGSLKSIEYVPSQYHSETANWFYLKVRDREEIASINFYSGMEVPTLESDFCLNWSDAEKEEHLQDYYTQYAYDDRRLKPYKYYHFVKKTQTDPTTGELIDEATLYTWEPCLKYLTPHNGQYHIRLRDKKQDDIEEWTYSTPEPIELPYMCGNKAVITKAELHSPDDDPDVAYYKPYLKLDMQGANENMFHYATWRFKNPSGVDVTNWFKSIRVGEYVYGGSLNIQSLIIFGSDDLNISNITAGDYTLEWSWMAPCININPSAMDVYNEIKVKRFESIIKKVERDADNPEILHIHFKDDFYIDTNYFKVNNKFRLELRKIPKDSNPDFMDSTDENKKNDYNDAYLDYRRTGEYNYYNYFDSVEESTDFSEVKTKEIQYATGVKVVGTNEIQIAIGENRKLLANDYMIKFYNDSHKTNFDDVKLDTKNNLIRYTCFEFKVAAELTDSIPEISSVTLSRFTEIPKKENGDWAHSYSGEGLDPMYKLGQEWETEGTRKEHIGDYYINVTDYKTYYYRKTPKVLNVKDGEQSTPSKDYEWYLPSSEPFLCVTFDAEKMPVYETFMNLYQDFTLVEMQIDNPWSDEDKKKPENERPELIYSIKEHLNDFFRHKLDYFKYETIQMVDGYSNYYKVINKIYIPFDPNKDATFPGTELGKFNLNFKHESGKEAEQIYKDLELKKIVLPRCQKEYGNIEDAKPFNPRIMTDEMDAGFVIKFTNDLGKSFVQSMKVYVKRQMTEDELSKVKAERKKYEEMTGTEIEEPIDPWVDVSYKFKSLHETYKEEFKDENVTEFKELTLFLDGNNFIDHGTYKIEIVGYRESSNVFNEGQEPVKMEKIIEKCPWISTLVPKEIKASLIKNGNKNPYLKIEFMDTLPPRSSLYRSKSNNKYNGHIQVVLHSNKKDYSDQFRGFNATSTKFVYDKDQAAANTDSIEKWVKEIRVVMKNNSAIPKGTFDVTLKFHSDALLENVPYVKKTNYTQFKTTEPVIARVGKFKNVKVKNKKVTLTIQKNKEVASNAALAKSGVGRVLRVKTWKQLLMKFKISMKKGKTEYANNFYNSKKEKKATANSITLKIKKNHVINPGRYKFSMKKGSTSVPIAPKTMDFKGVIWNKFGGAGNDPNVWIIDEKEPDGKENCCVYKDYALAYQRVLEMRHLNRVAKYQWKLCKKCRKVKLLRTKKIKGCINTYDFPYEHKQGIAKFFKQLTKKWYKYRSKKVTISFAKGKKLNDDAKLVKSKKYPNKKFKYNCNKYPMLGFQFRKKAEGKGAERHISYGCANYTKKGSKWKWKLRIATVKKGQLPKKEKKKIYFATIKWQGEELARGFKATKKGKKSSGFKKYVKKMRKKIKARKKEIARCTRCRKKTLAEKNGKNIGWGAARFPIQVMSRKDMKNLPKLLNVKEKKGGFKTKKKKTKNGCKSASFVWAKTTMKKKSFAKLKCKKGKPTDKTLSVDSFQGVYYCSVSTVRRLGKSSPSSLMMTDPSKLAKTGKKKK